jgi:hypothetical protein
MESQYHATVIRTSLTRNIGPRFEDIHDQIIKAYDEGIACKGKGVSDMLAFLFE